MDKALFIPSAIMSLVIVLVYAVVCIRNKSELDQKTIINLILQAFQMICGGVLIASTIISDLKELVTDLSLYILIAGAVLLVNSGQSVISDLRKPISKAKKPIKSNAGVVAD
jgi:drug/metabolite transporter (DMT)-like permease